MIKIAKILIALLSVTVIAGAWLMYTTISPRLNAEQKQLLEDADEYLSRGIYDIGAELLNKALQIETDKNPDIWRKLAESYKAWGDLEQYQDTLQAMISGNILPKGESLAGLYTELYALYKDEQTGKSIKETLALLREGIKKTGSEDLRKIYEAERYSTTPGRYFYDDAYAIKDGAGLVLIGGLWGYAGKTGNIVIRPEFELATNFAISGDDAYAAVYKNGELYIINSSGNRRALADVYIKDPVEIGEIARFTGTYFSLREQGSEDFAILEWTNTYASPVITERENRYEYYGLTTDGFTAAKENGGWHIRDASGQIAGDRLFDEIALDEFGRCTAEGAGAIFVKTGGEYNMIGYDGEKIAGPFEDAKPFFEKDCWAAVKKNGKWGFIDASGKIAIDFIYEDAGSSTKISSPISDEIIAPVKKDGLWGYIKTDGGFAIEPQYKCAKQFVNGCAPIMEAKAGWYYILLAEYSS